MRTGIYEFTHIWTGQKKQINVDIIGETSKSYKVRYKEFHPNGQKPGYETWVSKKAIKN